ncbi:MAG: iron-sulfur cluster assembly protein [Burkholderiales bacterium]|nr:iron-sulfur cluster assembly protein [Burkholderiales bacterium]
MALRVVPDRAGQVDACLATVMDPELDEPVTELGFVTGVDIGAGGEVRVGFRLPTYWCAANFAFLMADDMRRALLALPWVTQAQVVLHDHMYAEAINLGVGAGEGFQACFAGAAEGGLEGLRRTFLLKAFQRRQAALLQYLLDQTVAPERLAAMDLEGLRTLALDYEGELLVERYLDRRGVVDAGPRAFVDVDGRPLAAEGLTRHLRELARVGVNAEFNSVLCRGLLAVRDKEAGVQPIAIVRRPTERRGAA